MNYKEKILSFIQESKDDAIEIFEEDGKSTDAIIKAHDLTYVIIENRFNNELRQYNNDSERAFDEFIARKNLDYLNVYVEELLLLDRDDEALYKAIRKHMRDLVHSLYALVNGQLDEYL